MGLIFDKINAEVAAREGLIAASGVGRIHLLPMRDRSLIEKRSRNIRAIRNDAAAKLGVLPSIKVVKFGQTFRVDFHKPNKAGWGFIGPRGVHQIYASATNLSTGKVHVWNGARKERLQCPNMPTGIVTANVIGTDAGRNPIHEIAENPLQAALDHFAQAALRGITAEEATDATSEWGNTTTVVYPDAGSGGGGSVDGAVYRSLSSTNGEAWATLVGGAATAKSDTIALQELAVARADSVSDKWIYNMENFFSFDTSAVGSDEVSSAIISFYGYDNSASDFADWEAVVVNWPMSNSEDALALGDYGTLGTTSYGSLGIASWVMSQYNDIALNGDGIANINGSGNSGFGVRNNYSISGTPPTWSSLAWTRVRIRYADAAGTSVDPSLTIEHAAAASGGSMISPLNLISRLGR